MADVAAETGDDELLADVGGPVGRHGRHQDLADRRHRLPALGRGLRRRVRAAAGPGLQRDLRRDRQLPVELAAAAGHRRAQVRRPHRARAVQRCSAPRSPPTGSGSSTSTRCSAATTTSKRTTRARRNEWFSCACCPPNIMRLMASLGHYLATTAGDALYVHQFAGASLGGEPGRRDPARRHDVRLSLVGPGGPAGAQRARPATAGSRSASRPGAGRASSWSTAARSAGPRRPRLPDRPAALAAR